MKKKIAFVVPRYGPKVNGGAETLCREYAESLVDDFEVTVLTTTAENYMQWDNAFKAGGEMINGVKVLRFKTKNRADDFEYFTEKMLSKRGDVEMAEEWMEKQGPYSADMLTYIEEHSEDYDQFLFVPYLYATTHFGLKKVRDKAILIPATHDEPTIYMKIFDEMFHGVKKIIFLTQQEREFAQKRFGELPENEVIGMGIEFPEDSNGVDLSRFDLPQRYAIYAGRIDPSKGCDQLFEYYEGSGLTEQLDLVFIGKKVMEIPDHINYLGFVSEEEKHALIAKAEFGILPSQYESFSISLLEYFAQKKPVLVNGKSEVLKGHCVRGNGGFWYENAEEWQIAAEYLMKNAEVAKTMGKNGYQYVKKNYDKMRVTQQLKELLSSS